MSETILDYVDTYKETHKNDHLYEEHWNCLICGYNLDSAYSTNYPCMCCLAAPEGWHIAEYNKIPKRRDVDISQMMWSIRKAGMLIENNEKQAEWYIDYALKIANSMVKIK